MLSPPGIGGNDFSRTTADCGRGDKCADRLDGEFGVAVCRRSCSEPGEGATLESAALAFPSASTYSQSSLILLVSLNPSKISRSGPEGRGETGEGTLEGGVPDGITGEKIWFLGEAVEGKEGVEACRVELRLRSPGPRSTRYDNGGGGGNGPSSSGLVDRVRALKATSDLFQVMMRQILENPPFFFSCLLSDLPSS